jgi:hypothetical protein
LQPQNGFALTQAKLMLMLKRSAQKLMSRGIALVRPEGFEPPTLGSEDRCSNPLSYGRLRNLDFRRKMDQDQAFFRKKSFLSLGRRGVCTRIARTLFRRRGETVKKKSIDCPDCRGLGIASGEFCGRCGKTGLLLIFEDDCAVCCNDGAIEDRESGFIICPANCEAARVLMVLIDEEEAEAREFAELQLEATIRCRGLTELSPELAYVDQVHFDPFHLLS